MTPEAKQSETRRTETVRRAPSKPPAEERRLYRPEGQTEDARVVFSDWASI